MKPRSRTTAPKNYSPNFNHTKHGTPRQTRSKDVISIFLNTFSLGKLTTRKKYKFYGTHDGPTKGSSERGLRWRQIAKQPSFHARTPNKNTHCKDDFSRVHLRSKVPWACPQVDHVSSHHRLEYFIRLRRKTLSERERNGEGVNRRGPAGKKAFLADWTPRRGRASAFRSPRARAFLA